MSFLRIAVLALIALIAIETLVKDESYDAHVSTTAESTVSSDWDVLFGEERVAPSEKHARFESESVRLLFHHLMRRIVLEHNVDVREDMVAAATADSQGNKRNQREKPSSLLERFRNIGNKLDKVMKVLMGAKNHSKSATLGSLMFRYRELLHDSETGAQKDAAEKEIVAEGLKVLDNYAKKIDEAPLPLSYIRIKRKQIRLVAGAAILALVCILLAPRSVRLELTLFLALVLYLGWKKRVTVAKKFGFSTEDLEISNYQDYNDRVRALVELDVAPPRHFQSMLLGRYSSYQEMFDDIMYGDDEKTAGQYKISATSWSTSQLEDTVLQLESGSFAQEDVSLQDMMEGEDATNQAQKHWTRARATHPKKQQAVINWYLSLVNIIHGLRIHLMDEHLIGVVGTGNVGKSTLCKELFGLETNPNFLIRTAELKLFTLPNNPDVGVLDFPGTNDIDEQVSSYFRRYNSMTSFFIVVVDATHVELDQLHLVDSVVETGLPFVVLLNFAHRLIASAPQISTERKEILIETTFSKLCSKLHVRADSNCFLVDLLHTPGQPTHPTILPLASVRKTLATHLGELGIQNPASLFV